ncbi:MAG: hypothetical protein JXR51_16490 [Bacteroidales bacterium]|nr:hypothetical protein [Bacteroidales bacterium]MBN2758766.1 hypothetical protein [Bacteroidales bacterium]
MNEDENDFYDLKDNVRKFNPNKLTIKFSGDNREFEKHFLVEYHNKSVNQIRLALFLALILYAFFGILDAALIPDFKYKFWTIRYLIIIPSLLGLLILTFTRIFKRYMQIISGTLVNISGFGIILIIWFAPPDLSNYYFAGLLLVIIMNYGFLRLRFIWATIAGFMVTVGYIIIAFNFIQMPFLLAVVNSFFLVSLNIIGMFIAYNFEYYARKNYFSNQLLKIEKVKLRTLNQRLDAKIKDKSAQFVNLNKEIQKEIDNLSKLEKEQK